MSKKSTAKKAIDRAEIRTVEHRTMGSRESLRKTERTDQRRQPKRGPGSQRKAGEEST